MSEIKREVAIPSTNFFPKKGKKDTKGSEVDMRSLRRKMLLDLTIGEKIHYYKLLKKRVKKKSSDDYYGAKRDPECLELYGFGSSFDLPLRFVVEYESFEVMYNKNKEEIGFKAILKNGHVDDRLELIVLKEKFSAKIQTLKL